MTLRELQAEAKAKETGPAFLGMPERWLDDPTWQCAQGHVSKHYIKSEHLGMDLCPCCLGEVLLFPPETKEATCRE